MDNISENSDALSELLGAADVYINRTASPEDVPGYHIKSARKVQLDVSPSELLASLGRKKTTRQSFLNLDDLDPSPVEAKRPVFSAPINIPPALNLVHTSADEASLKALEAKLEQRVRKSKGGNTWARRLAPERDDESGVWGVHEMERILQRDTEGTHIPSPNKDAIVEAQFKLGLWPSGEESNPFARLTRLVHPRGKQTTLLRPSQRVARWIKERRDRERSPPANTRSVQRPCSAPLDTSTVRTKVPLIRYPGQLMSADGKPTLEGLQMEHVSVRFPPPVCSPPPSIPSSPSSSSSVSCTSPCPSADTHHTPCQRKDYTARRRIELDDVEKQRRRATRVFAELCPVGGTVHAPVPIEEWVGEPSHWSELKVPSEVHIATPQILDDRREEKSRMDLIRSLRRSRNKELCEWRNLCKELERANPMPPRNNDISLRRAAENLRMTPFQRKRMALPAHLAYRTIGGLRNH